MSGKVVLIGSEKMGCGEPELGKKLMKAFLYALTEAPEAPSHVLLYNSGAYLSQEGQETVEDLQKLKDAGCEILTCGTCTEFFNISDTVAVGEITNMYEIVEICTEADSVIRP